MEGCSGGVRFESCASVIKSVLIGKLNNLIRSSTSPGNEPTSSEIENCIERYSEFNGRFIYYLDQSKPIFSTHTMVAKGSAEPKVPSYRNKE